MTAPENDPAIFDFSFLRDLRKREGLTLNQLSERSGVSVAVISKLERNQTKVELETLYRLARPFRLGASNLLALAEGPLARRGTMRDYRSGEFTFRQLAFDNCHCYLGEAPAGGQNAHPEIHTDEIEIVWVLDGKIRLDLAHEHYELNAGDSLQFDGIREHRYTAILDTRLILIHLPKHKDLGS